MRHGQALLPVTLIGLLLGLRGGVSAEEPARSAGSDTPPWQRTLQGRDAVQASDLARESNQLQRRGKFEEALKAAKALAELRTRLQGADHWEAVNTRWEVEALRRVLLQGKEVRLDYARDPSRLTQAIALEKQRRFEEALPLWHKLLATRLKVVGADHPAIAVCHFNLAVSQARQKKHAEAVASHRKALDIRRKALGEDHPRTAASYRNVALNLARQGKHPEAEAGYRQALTVHRRVFGEDHLDTGNSYDELALNLSRQGKYAEAEEVHRKALAVHRRLRGEDHPDTATSHNNLALNLDHQGKHAEAHKGNQQALAIRRKALGEDHPDTATSYNNAAVNLDHLGKHAEAAEGFQKALAIRRKVLGEEHADTATSYSDAAVNLSRQEKHAEAEEFYRKALAIRRKVLGEEHYHTAASYNNMGTNLDAQRKYAEAEEHFTKALAICYKVLGEAHPYTAITCHNAGATLTLQGKYAEAEQVHKRALAICQKLLGEDHPDTAAGYNLVATSQTIQGKHAEAEEGYRKALAICRTVLGEDHPLTAKNYKDLAANLSVRGKFAEAEALGLVAADHFLKVRLRLAASGLERAAVTGKQSPLPALAAVLARNGKPDAGWRWFEEGLARGTWDELSTRLRRPPAEQAKQAQFIAQLDRLDQLLARSVPGNKATPEQRRQREELLTQRRQVRDELDAFGKQLEKIYGPAAGQVFDRATIQASLPGDAALIAWLDLPTPLISHDADAGHWAILLRSAGDPVWLRLRGSGPKDAWTITDKELAQELRAALEATTGKWQPLAERLRLQRLQPLTKYLAASDKLPAVRHLIVLPSPALKGVPVEVFATGYTVSYAHSGTLLAHIRKQPKPDSKGLFALADPVFDLPKETEALPLPRSGILLTGIVPDSNAARSGLRPNDVLLRYHETDLAGPADLKLLPESSDPTKRVAVTVWRNGRTTEREVLPGKLGVVMASEPAPKAMAEQRRLDKRLAAATRGDWEQLPGTRAEVDALRRLFTDDAASKALFDSQASEQQMYDLAKANALSQYRYVHLATHGEVDDRFPLRSAVILSRDDLPDAGKQLNASLPVFTGRLTVESILRHWNLQCELVTLSACQTALGKYEKGEGFIGFAQALTLAGSRSVCLSLWKVDDAATALLMERFYQNLLGKRDGLKTPLKKAEALKEAKEWLRTLSHDEAVKRTAQLTKGVDRGKRGGYKAALPIRKVEDKEDSPFAHPYYWAAFVLIGDPD